MSAQITMQHKITQEIENYLQVSVQNIDKSPLKWWKSEEAKFSLLGKWQRSTYVHVLQAWHVKQCLVRLGILCQM